MIYYVAWLFLHEKIHGNDEMEHKKIVLQRPSIKFKSVALLICLLFTQNTRNRSVHNASIGHIGANRSNVQHRQQPFVCLHNKHLLLSLLLCLPSFLPPPISCSLADSRHEPDHILFCHLQWPVQLFVTKAIKIMILSLPFCASCCFRVFCTIEFTSVSCLFVRLLFALFFLCTRQYCEYHIIILEFGCFGIFHVGQKK